MSEIFKIVLITLLTVSGGIIIGQIITSFFIQPVHEWLMLIPLNYELTRLLKFGIKIPDTEYVFCDEDGNLFSTINRS